MVPGANIGEDIAVFEAVHGSAPDIAGKSIANPMGLMKSSVLMLAHLGELSASERLGKALDAVILDGGANTKDLGGDKTTDDVASAVISRLKE